MADHVLENENCQHCNLTVYFIILFKISRKCLKKNFELGIGSRKSNQHEKEIEKRTCEFKI